MIITDEKDGEWSIELFEYPKVEGYAHVHKYRVSVKHGDESHVLLIADES